MSMRLLSIESLFNNPFTRALSWTLLHSLWQGLILAVLTAAMMLLTRRSGARLRYLLLIQLFLLFIAVSGITFCLELRSASGLPAAVSLPATTTHTAQDTDILFSPKTVELSLPEKISQYCNEHAAVIFIVWLFFFSIKSVQLLSSAVYVQRVRHYKTKQPDVWWKNRLEALIRHLGIRQPVSLLESAIVTTPVVIGFLKPVILMPLGLLSHLSAEEVEAILLHELAHIRRRDYLVNLFQSFAETLFFFNPAVNWLSSLIREEREHCCDDVAIGITNDKPRFIRALLSFQEYQGQASGYGMGFFNRKNLLLNRVKRIIYNRNKTLNTMEKSFLSLAVAAATLFSFSATKKLNPPAVAAATGAGVAVSSTPKNTMPKKTAAFKSSSPELAVRQHADLIRQLPVLLSVDTVPPKPPPAQSKALHDTAGLRYPHMSASVNDDGQNRVIEMDVKDKTGRQIHFRKENDKITELEINGTPVSEANRPQYAQELNDIETEWKEVSRAKREAQRERMQEMREKMQLVNRVMRKRSDSLGHLNNLFRLKNDSLRQVMDVKRREMEVKNRELLHRYNQNRERLDTLHQEKQRLMRLQMDTLHKRQSVQVREQIQLINLMRKNGRVDSLRAHRPDSLWKRQSVQVQEQRQLINLMRKNGRIDSLRARRTDSAREKHYRDGNGIRPDKPENITAMSRSKADAMAVRRAADEAMLSEQSAKMKNIIADLQKNNITIDRDRSWFGLDNDRLVVDGKTMPESLHTYLKEKYAVSNGHGYYYGAAQMTGRGTFLEAKDLR